MATLINYLTMILTVQLFYALGVTLFVYSIPAADLSRVSIAQFQEPADRYSFEEIGSAVSVSSETQLELPLVDMTTLVGYSGNIVLDLVFNFATAVPQMITLLIGAMLAFFSIDKHIAVYITVFAFIMITVMYLIAGTLLVLNIRSQGAVYA